MCVLRISGTDLDPAALLQGSTLQPYRTYRAGQPRNAAKPDGPKWPTSGINIDVSNAPWSDLDQQVVDADRFLERHAHEIDHLRRSPGVEDVRLDFPVDSRLATSVLVQSLYLPPEFAEKAGRLGVGLELSLYAGYEGEEPAG